MADTARVQADFDEIALLADPGESGSDRYDQVLLSLIPNDATRVLDIGCGLGRLTLAAARAEREVTGVDLSPVMINKAGNNARAPGVSFIVGDFLTLDFDRTFDCVLSAAALHHMPCDAAVQRMADLVKPGGRLIIQDLRRDASLVDWAFSHAALTDSMVRRFLRTGRPLRARPVRDAWARHGESETYLSLDEACAMAARLLPGSTVTNHWMWRYTIVWDKP